jgi:carbon storage regulator
MLTLTRSVGETIRIGDDIEVHVVEVRGGTVRLGFKAPREVAIHREEVYRQIAEANLLAAQVTADSLGALAAFAPSAAAEAAAGRATGDVADEPAAGFDVDSDPVEGPSEGVEPSSVATPATVRPATAGPRDASA